MSKRGKLGILIIGLLAVLAAIYFVVLLSKTKQNYQNNPIGTPVSDVSDWKTISNTICGLNFKIPKEWTDQSLLGESKILSPEDIRINTEFEQTHQDLIKNEPGDAPLGPDARTLYISCQFDLKKYIESYSSSKKFKNFSDTKTLAAFIASDAFNNKNGEHALINTITIDGQTAYEISDSGALGGHLLTTYEILFERNNKIGEIMTGQIPYEQLSDTAKDIIKTINFNRS